MAIFHISSAQGKLFNPHDRFQNFDESLKSAIRQCPIDKPIVIMIHGYKYSINNSTTCPHQTLFAEEINRRDWNLRSWPAQLDMTQCDNRNGLVIGYGWDAAPRFQTCWNNLPDIYHRAQIEAASLSKVINLIAKYADKRSIDILAHSMGARIALLALRKLRLPTVKRLVLLGGTEYWQIAQRCTQNQKVEVYNIKAKQNRLYDILFKKFGPSQDRQNTLLGEPNTHTLENWVDICIDDPKTCAVLRKMNINVSPAPYGFSHWGFYTRAGIFDLYRGIFDRSPNLDLPNLRNRLEDPNAKSQLPSRFDFILNSLISTILPRKLRH